MTNRKLKSIAFKTLNYDSILYRHLQSFYKGICIQKRKYFKLTPKIKQNCL